jgi:alkylation response protein AidB-like acyl-CoA dehydrogenase
MEVDMGIAAPERPPTHGGVSEAERERERQIRQAEELLFSGPSREGFAKALFRGEFHAGSLFPYPELPEAERATVEQAIADVKAFAASSIDPEAIDRDAEIPQSVVDGLGRLGVLGMTAPVEYGGRGFSQSGYCRIMEIIGGHCAGTAVFVNAHHSIGIRALLLFGTPAQKARWLPELTSGRTLAAFALTETEAGSDAANVQTTATPSPDGKTYILNGTKRWITNGGIAGVLTVMARTPDPKGGDSKITAFLVTPDMPGFEVVEKRMEKFSIRGTATGRLAFHDMPVPAENILGPLGKGLRVALTVLDFGRVTFGASCTGVAKHCVRMATEHALRRRQFGRPLADIELVRKKLAYLASTAYAMEATTYETAVLIDRGGDDYMLETAILKVFATEELWQGVYETMQVFGGSSFFADKPLGRMMRDARLNTVGEGANEVLKAFIALVGMRDVGEGFKSTLSDLKNPLKTLPTLWRFGSVRARRAMTRPHVPVVSDALRPHAHALGRRVRSFAWAVERQLMRHRESILEMQYIQERIADAAIALVTSACTLARIDRSLSNGTATDLDRTSADLYLRTAARKFDRCLHDLKHNDDPHTTETALAAMRTFG